MRELTLPTKWLHRLATNRHGQTGAATVAYLATANNTQDQWRYQARPHVTCDETYRRKQLSNVKTTRCYPQL